MREFLESDDDIRRLDHLVGQVAMHVQFGADNRIRPGDDAGMRQQIALAIIIAARHHRAMQAEQHDIDRHRRAELIENLVAQAFIGLARNEPGRLGPGGGAFEERKAIGAGAAARRHHRAGTERRRLGMSAGRAIEGALERASIDEERREGIRLGRQKRHKNPHCRPLLVMPEMHDFLYSTLWNNALAAWWKFKRQEAPGVNTVAEVHLT